ncbi:glutamate ABC transporter substrate-binding protein [Streptomyces sp. NPDC006879]|uniref:glutamate ABC transporter substrate-binding protein n=1 Tax=Streptomyces sp. NPDC006879 TaxID=3364767 RepID=UPI0036B0C139
MMMSKSGVAVATVVLALTATGCSGQGDGQKTISIGIKYDQPGLGLKTADSFTGFDVDVARYVAKELGYKPEQIIFKRVASSDREVMLRFGEVKFVVASYSINAKRKEKVDFAGPYFKAHQDLLVRADDDSITEASDLNKKILCSVTGSTSAQNIKVRLAPKADLLELGDYSECLAALEDTRLDALTTDDTILAGYAAQPENEGKFKLAGLNLSDESYGIGVKKGATELQSQINKALRKMIDDGSWQRFASANFGSAGYENEPAPQITEGS